VLTLSVTAADPLVGGISELLVYARLVAVALPAVTVPVSLAVEIVVDPAVTTTGPLLTAVVADNVAV
jgi:hypothetical protein